MTYAPSTQIEESRIQAPALNTTVWLAGAAFLLVLAIVICLDAISPGTSPPDLALMVVFP